MSLRLTGGEARGANLFSPAGWRVRPAMAQLRVTVFQLLGPRLPGAVVLDLFAGTGALGFEALSRGAALAILVDRDPRAVEAMRRSAAKLRWAERCAIVRGDAFGCRRKVEKIGRPPGIVFVDPPYAVYDDPRGSVRLARLVEGLVGGEATAPEGMVVVEHPGRAAWVAGLGLGVVDERRFGGTVVTFLSWSRGSGGV